MGSPYSWHAYISCGSVAYSTETSRRIWHGGKFHRTATVQNGDWSGTTATSGNQVVSHSWPKHPHGNMFATTQPASLWRPEGLAVSKTKLVSTKGIHRTRGQGFPDPDNTERLKKHNHLRFGRRPYSLIRQCRC